MKFSIYDVCNDYSLDYKETRPFGTIQEVMKYCDQHYGTQMWLQRTDGAMDGYNEYKELIIRIKAATVEIDQNDLLEELNAFLPLPQYEFKSLANGLIYFEYEGIEIVNPFYSDCGRFVMDPYEAYGIPRIIALGILFNNKLMYERNPRAVDFVHGSLLSD